MIAGTFEGCARSWNRRAESSCDPASHVVVGAGLHPGWRRPRLGRQAPPMAAIHYEATYRAPVDRVISVLTDESFLSAYAQEVGALKYEVGVEREGDEPDAPVRTRVAMTVPTSGVPAVFK